MKITIELNGVKVEKEIPTSWEEVTYRQFLGLAEAGKDWAKIFSLFTGIEESTLRKALILNLATVMNLMGFLEIPAQARITDKILGYPVPVDIGLQTLDRFIDLKKDIETHAKTIETRFPLYCAMYAVEPYDWQEAEKLAPVFLDAPAMEVLAVGSFTLERLIVSRLPTRNDSPKSKVLPKKHRRVLTVWLKNLASMVRSWRWRRKPGALLKN